MATPKAKTPAKPPVNVPSPGDACKLRGRESFGVLEWVNSKNWASVTWDKDHPGPRFVHLFELERKV